MTPTAQQSSAPAPSLLAGPLACAPAATAARRPARPLTETAHGICDRAPRRDRERASTAPGGRPCCG
ncbi:hypothetical protein ACF1GW_21015 [Streptomyces achromogenes]|uniref:hypothetical protein n=1 Tax=Streptomyces achromogenes TaxID=67255 RepID=UPI0036FFF8E9